jgi:cell division protein FtsB
LQAEEITLTIGQAFELAYRRFLETSGKDLAVQQRIVALQGRNRQLEAETTELRRRLRDLAALTSQV